MSVEIVKRFNTIETLSHLLTYREIMFQLIKQIDKSAEQAVAKIDFYHIVTKFKNNLSREERKTLSLVFDCDNLMQSKILSDIRVTNGVTKLWFNTAIIDVFRLCEISLFRPLTSVSLKASMSPLWSIQAEFDSKQLSVTPGTLDYKEWTAEIIHRLAELLGTIRANISKLERVGDVFEKEVVDVHNQAKSIEMIREKYRQANNLYVREILPLSIFLNKDTRYEKGDGLYLILGQFCSAFEAIGDTDAASLMNAYQIQCLDLFQPIKRVATHVNTFLQKTSAAIAEHTSIERAFQVLRAAFEDTLGGDQRNKFIKIENLKALALRHPVHGVARLPAMRLDRTPAFINVVIDELASRGESPSSDEVRLLFEESVNRSNRLKLEYQEKLETWIASFEWTLGQDFILTAVNALKQSVDGFTLPDIFIVIARVLKNPSLTVVSTGRFNEVEDDNHKVKYRVRYISAISD